MLTLAKRYRFSAAHTLRAPHLSEVDNRRVYGKCAHPSGHGHDYTIEIALSRRLLTDDVVFGRGQLDALVRSHLAPRFAYADLNSSFGSDFISSGENLATAVYQLLRPHLPDDLELSVRIEETEKNAFRHDGSQAF